MTASLGAPRLRYSPSLDGIRGVSVLAVVGFHAFGFPSGGFLGVQVFFVLSGFLITVLLVQEWEASGSISLRAFYRRRALRLVPALVTVVAAYLAISAVRFSVGDPNAAGGFGEAARASLFGLAYVSNLVFAFHGNLPSGIQHLWSLAAEEQFYLVWPVILVLLLRARAGRTALLALAGLGTVFVALHRLQLTLQGAPERRVFAAPDATADALLVGCFLGVLYCSGTLHRIVEKAAWRRVAVPLAAAGLAAAFMLVPNTDYRPLYESVLPFVGLASAVVVGEAACGRGGWLTRLLEQRRLVWVGTISYGFYLWHPVLLYGTGLRLPLPSVLAALAVARLSYVYVEQPFLRRRRGKTAAHDRPSVVAAPAALPSTATP